MGDSNPATTEIIAEPIIAEPIIVQQITAEPMNEIDNETLLNNIVDADTELSQKTTRTEGGGDSFLSYTPTVSDNEDDGALSKTDSPECTEMSQGAPHAGDPNTPGMNPCDTSSPIINTYVPYDTSIPTTATTEEDTEETTNKCEDVSTVEERKIPAPTAVKNYYTRRNAKKLVTPLKTAPSRRKSRKLDVKDAADNPAALKLELSSFRNALNNMESILFKQQEEIVSLKEELQKTRDEAKSSMLQEVNRCEDRILKHYADLETTCTAKKRLLRNDIQKTLDKLSTKADKALKMSGENHIRSTTTTCPLSETMKNATMDIEKLEHEIVSLQHSMNAYELSGSTKVKRNLRKSPLIFGENSEDAPRSPSPSPHADVTTEYGKAEEEEEKEVTTNQPTNQLTTNDSPRNNTNSPKRSIMFIDSNRAYLEIEKLWKHLQLIPTGSVGELRQRLTETNLKDINVVTVHVGVNDLDRKDGTQVAKDIFQIATEMMERMPAGGKVIVSEITPRQLTKDDEVKKCNKHLQELIKDNPNFILARHGNLRNDEWSFHKNNDDKHLAKESIARFASNLKIAFRKAIGIERNEPWRKQKHHRKPGAKHYEQENTDNTNIKSLLKRELLRLLKL